MSKKKCDPRKLLEKIKREMRKKGYVIVEAGYNGAIDAYEILAYPQGDSNVDIAIEIQNDCRVTVDVDAPYGKSYSYEASVYEDELLEIVEKAGGEIW